MSNEYEIKTPKIEDTLEEEDFEEEDLDDEDLDDEDSPSVGVLGKVLFFLLAFCLGVGVTTAFHQYQPGQEEALPQEELVLPDPPVPEPHSMSDLLVQGVSFGDSVTEMLLADPALFALSDQGNHYGLFTAGLTLPWNQTVSLRNIFYFYHEDKTMYAVQYLLKPTEDALTTEEIQVIQEELSAMFTPFYESQDYFVWQGEGGFVGFQVSQMFLYLCQTEGQIRGVFQ